MKLQQWDLFFEGRSEENVSFYFIFIFAFLGYFPYVTSTLSVCPPPINFRMAEPIFMKLGVYIMILEATYTLYTKNPTDRRYIA
jgi:hypothetical protein